MDLYALWFLSTRKIGLLEYCDPWQILTNTDNEINWRFRNERFIQSKFTFNTPSSDGHFVVSVLLALFWEKKNVDQDHID